MVKKSYRDNNVKSHSFFNLSISLLIHKWNFKPIPLKYMDDLNTCFLSKCSFEEKNLILEDKPEFTSLPHEEFSYGKSVSFSRRKVRLLRQSRLFSAGKSYVSIKFVYVYGWEGRFVKPNKHGTTKHWFKFPPHSRLTVCANQTILSRLFCKTFPISPFAILYLDICDPL